VTDVVAEWSRAAERALALGLTKDALVMDPGLGFAKNARQSTALLAAIGTITREVGVPVCVGASRKSFLVAGDPVAPSERIGASIAAALFAARNGAAILRVHDVRETRQALDLERRLGASAKAEVP
jgi:dihydropteroate synthase